MVRLPWRRREGQSDEPPPAGGDEADGPEPVVSCAFQDGTLSVYEDRVTIERPSRSRFADASIPAAEITGVEFSPGLTIGYLQIQRAGVEPDRAGILSDPVDENTVHFGRGGRSCAREAREEILERATA